MTDAASEPDATLVERHEPLMGTTVELRITPKPGRGRLVRSAARLVVDEIDRLERVFSAFDPSSELCRWRRGELLEPGPELSAALATALEWQIRSNGAFNPSSGVLSDTWRQAEVQGRPPDPQRLAALAASITEPAYRIVDGAPQVTGDCSALNLNAFVKGWIVDRAAGLAMERCELAEIVVNAGGDLLHLGNGSSVVGIENPHRPYDNEPPLTRVRIARCGLATSGSARRGFRVGGRRYGHVLDPRTGNPVDAIASISVVADDAATADVLATVLGVVDPAAAIELADEYGVACFAVGKDRGQWRTSTWRELELAASQRDGRLTRG